MNDTPSNNENEVIEQTSLKENQNSKNAVKDIKKFIYPTLFVLLIPIIAFGAKKYNDMKEEEHQENLDYAVLCEENYNVTDYQSFLEKYPESKYNIEVEKRLNELQTMAMEWEAIKDSKNTEDFINFRQQNNDEHYNRLCDLKLDSMEWSNAKSANTPDAYQAYINQHPNGTYVSEAIIAKGEVGYMNLTENELTYIHETCNQLFSALGVNNADSVISLLDLDLEEFLHLQSPVQNDVAQWIHGNKDQGTLRSYIITDSIKSQRAFNSERGIGYVSNFSVEQISTDAQGIETKEPLIATVKQNRKFKIYSLTLKHL